jgi:SNF2 family DNA or RNA helicase
MANHLIFVSPYLTLGSTAQEDYAKARTQAKGRAIRFGQGKDVHIHDFLSTYTIDVDVYEHREMKVIKDVEGQPTLLHAGFGEHGDYSSRLREKIFNVEGEEV